MRFLTEVVLQLYAACKEFRGNYIPSIDARRACRQLPVKKYFRVKALLRERAFIIRRALTLNWFNVRARP